MSYQVLARKYRPKNFDQIVGQKHILSSLKHGLDHNRLHHAYLFTGTRGVGKTSLARLFVKCLNCEKGVSSTPCNHCSTCQAINENRYVDLIEIDAASRTKVEDTRDILDNVQYMPTQGSYKVYLIDEVHMLSIHSFNALLKTLEEPPEHVKFVLATTDPKKLPVTVLSRCLQFHLKNLSNTEIVGQLQQIVENEQLSYELEALGILAKSANGSLRDALSLLDQAINYSQGKLVAGEMAAMLGVIENKVALQLLDFVCDKKANELIGYVNDICEQGADGWQVLQRLAETLYIIQLYQATQSVHDETFTSEDIALMAKKIHPEHCQLLYQIVIQSKPDVPLAPDESIGLQMVLLRMLAFIPAHMDGIEPQKALPQCEGSVSDTDEISSDATSGADYQDKKVINTPQPDQPGQQLDWNQIVSRSTLKGVPKQIIHNSLLKSYDAQTVTLYLKPSYQEMLTDKVHARIEQELSSLLQTTIKLMIETEGQDQSVSKKKVLTPAEVEHDKKQAAINEAYQALHQNEHVRQICQDLNIDMDKDHIYLKTVK